MFGKVLKKRRKEQNLKTIFVADTLNEDVFEAIASENLVEYINGTSDNIFIYETYQKASDKIDILKERHEAAEYTRYLEGRAEDRNED